MRTLALIGLIFLTACGDRNDGGATTPPTGGADVTDAALSTLARATTGWTYYRNRPDTLMRSPASGHSPERLRTRFNARAATSLDAGGKVRAGAVFPDSSLIVKELISGSSLVRYAVMYKLRGSPNAGAGGWLWAYYAPDGATQIGTAGRGAACQGCHSAGIDYTRMNDSHP